MPDREESTVDLIRHLKRQEPFVPFKLVMNIGDRYVIDDPDALAIARSQLHFYPRNGMGIHLRTNQVTGVEENGEKRPSRRGSKKK